MKTIIIVYGPPNSGKTTWALSQMKEDDIIVDLDRLQSAVSPSPLYALSSTGHEAAGVLKNAMIDWLARREGEWQTAYVIGGYPKRGQRAGLQRKLKASVHFVDTPLSVCLSRNPKNSSYPQCIYDWFDMYEPGTYSKCDPKAQKFYDSAEWKRLRKRVLDMDHHECQVCKGKGKYTKANIVHHVHHIDERWDLRDQVYYNGERQLISVCAECHAHLHPERYEQASSGKQMTEEKW